ncbi:MAG: M28 family peptidase [Clostridiales bacterium]|nr:M28 family peptidase [Clostridiales bacterium]
MKHFKKVIFLIVASVIIFTSCSVKVGYNPHNYDADNIIKMIGELSSKSFNGRMAGTPYGIKTEEYVASKFKKAGLKPAGVGGTFYQEFLGVSGNPTPEYILEVKDGNNMVKGYKYGKDYSFFTYMSHKGEATGRGVPVNLSDKNIKGVKNAIALIKYFKDADSNTLSMLYKKGYTGVITASGDPSDRRKGQFGVNDMEVSSKLPRVCVDLDVFDELMDYSKKGYTIHLKSSFEVKSFKARNVIGILNSNRKSDDYLIISAHMDHLGPDPDGVYFPGALDNASGTSSIIEIARALSKQPVKPDKNIVFIAFSGEEENLFGSQYYVSHPIYPLKNSEVINLDMVGAKSNLPLSIFRYGSSERASGNSILNELKSSADERKIKYSIENNGSSDHMPFGSVGVPSVTLIDLEKNIYHVPEDTIENIGRDNLKRDIGLVMDVIGENAYTQKRYSNLFIICIIAGIMTIIVIAIRHNRMRIVKIN